MAEGLQEIESLRSAGFNPEEINQWKTETEATLYDAGFSDAEVDQYFGRKDFDESRVKKPFQENIQAKASGGSEGQGQKGQTENKPKAPKLEEADSILDALEAGFDMSVTGLMKQPPDMVLNENAPRYYRIASQVATLAGDLPAMIAGGTVGFVAGGAVGTATVPGLGTVSGAAVGAGAGTFALPEGLRTAYLEAYENGEIDDFSEFWDRTAAITINSLKGGTIGALTVLSGGAAGAAAKSLGGGAVAKTASQLAAEVTTMVGVGAALEGEVPNPDDFIDAAILVGGLRAAGKASSRVGGKIRDIYKKTGMKPEDVAAEAAKNPKVRQEILSDNNTPLVKKPTSLPTQEGIITVEKAPKPSDIIFSENTQSILSKIGEKAGNKTKLPTANEVYTAFVDKLNPINEAVKVLKEGKEVTAENNPYILSRMVVDHKAKAKTAFEKGTIDFNTKEINGKSLKNIMESVESPDVLNAYMISKRVVEKNAQGLKTGFDVDAAKATVKEHAAKYEAAAKEVTDFSNRVLEYVKDSGVLSESSFKAMKEANKDYVPFKRIIEETGIVGEKKGGKSSSLKEFKGSERDIQNPITSIVENTVELYKIAETNRPYVKLIELAEKSTTQELIKKVPDSIEAKTGKSKTDIPLAEYAKKRASLAKNQFEVYRNGKREVYETTPALAEALQKLGGDGTSMNIGLRILNGVTQFKKVGITFTPDFIARNFQRDFVTGNVFSKYGVTPMDVFGAMGDIVSKSDNYYKWLRSGGANGAFLEMGERYISKDIINLQRETNFMGSARNALMKPIDVMRVGAELAEQSLRLAEFNKVYKKTGSIVEGGFAAREITLDFQRVGARISALNSITAFLNVSIQGLDKTGRAFKESPLGTTARAGLAITAPSVLLWWANKDDQRVQEIPRWERDLFWIVPTDSWQEVTPGEAQDYPDYMVRESNGKIMVNKGSIYRIPKPMELGVIFGSMPERALDAYFKDNPRAFKEFNETIVDLITPNFLPDASIPVVEQVFNRSTFTGQDIIPHHMEGIMPKYQFTEYTSETAKTLGSLISEVHDTTTFASPLILDNYIRSWGGSLGQYALKLTNEALRKSGVQPDTPKPEDTLSDIPVIKAFAVRFPRSGAQSVSDFYDEYRPFEVKQNSIKFLEKNAVTDQDLETLQKEYADPATQEKLVELTGIKDALGQLASVIRNVNKDPSMSPSEKRQIIDGLYFMRIETAKAGLEAMDEIKKSLEGSKQ